MPVTAKLSRKFYERLGDDVANELVEWFNLVDAAYRSDLKELNELNFARFDAKLEQRLAELRAEILTRVAEVKVELRSELQELRSDMHAGFARTDQHMAELETRLTKRLFGFWIAQAAATAGLVFGVVKLLVT